MEERKRSNEAADHQLTLSNRGSLKLEGATNLGSYDQELIILEIDEMILEIKGEELHIKQLNLDQGQVVVEGKINAMIYVENIVGKKSKGFFSKLIK